MVTGDSLSARFFQLHFDDLFGRTSGLRIFSCFRIFLFHETHEQSIIFKGGGKLFLEPLSILS